MADLEVRMRYLPDADTNIPLPAYETAGAAGLDLRANLAGQTKISLAPGARALVPTGLAMEIPFGFEAQIRPRSGLALKNGISLVNAPGTIDCDYRGPLGVILINHGSDEFEIHHGDRIAQMVFAPVARADVRLVSELDETDRGAGGFGSTGTS